jgi:hypothetical protein
MTPSLGRAPSVYHQHQQRYSQESSNGASTIDDAERQRKRKEAGANIRELRKGITLDPTSPSATL